MSLKSLLRATLKTFLVQFASDAATALVEEATDEYRRRRGLEPKDDRPPSDKPEAEKGPEARLRKP